MSSFVLALVLCVKTPSPAPTLGAQRSSADAGVPRRPAAPPPKKAKKPDHGPRAEEE